MNFRYIKVTLLVAFTLTIGILSAQLRTAPEPTLANPYNTMVVHLYYLQTDSYDPDTAALTIAPEEGLDSAERVEIAVKIKQIFDGKGLYVRLNTIPQNPDFRDSVNQEHYFTPFPADVPEIYLEKIGDQWFYSRETVLLVPKLHNRVYPLGSDFLVKILPHKANAKFLGLFIWQHVGMLVITLIVVLAFIIVRRIFRWIIHLIARKRPNWSFLNDKHRRRLARFASIGMSLWVAKMMLPAVGLPVRANEIVNKSLDIIIALMVMSLALVLIGIFKHRLRPVTEETESKMDEQLLPIVERMAQGVVLVITIFFILDKLNVNVTALIAGISIGGLALALAAQDTVKNLIGSALIFLDKPFQIGDYVLAGGHEGTVVEVGFRSTRLMQIDTSIIAIPNGSISNMPLTNLGVRESRLLNMMIGVLYETPPDLIEEFISRLRKLVLEHPNTKDDPSYVHLREFADSSINIMFRCYLTVNTFAEELAIKEDILFKILRIAEEVGVEFAYPTTMVHLAKGNNGD